MTIQEHTIRCNAWVVGLAMLGLTSAAPVLAAPDYMDGAFIAAKDAHGKASRPDQRDTGKDASRDDRPASGRKDDRDEPDAYGYGYERRQQQRNGNDSRSRGRR